MKGNMDFLARKCCCPPKPACLTIPDCLKHDFWRCCGFDPVMIDGGIPVCGYATGTAYCENPPSEQAEYAFLSYVIEVAPPPSGGEFYTWNGMVFPGGSGIPTVFTGKVGLPLCPGHYNPGGTYCSSDYIGRASAGTGIYETYGGYEGGPHDSWENHFDCVEQWQTWKAVNDMSNVSSNAGNGGTWEDCCLPAYDNYTLEYQGDGQSDWVYSHTTPEQCGSPSVWSRMDGECNNCLYCNPPDHHNPHVCGEYENECGGGAHCTGDWWDYPPEPVQYPCGASCVSGVAQNWIVAGELSQVSWSSHCTQGICWGRCCVTVKHTVTWQNMATGQTINRTWTATSELDPSAREGSCRLKLVKRNWHESIGRYHEAVPFVVGPKYCRPDVVWGGDWEAGEICSMNSLPVMKPLRYCDPCDPYSWCQDTGLGTGASGHVDDCYGMGAGEQGDWCGCFAPTYSVYCQPAKILSFEIFAT